MQVAATAPTQRTFGEVWAEQQLSKATKGWTAPVLIRQYKSDSDGLKAANIEAGMLAAHCYEVAGHSGEGGHLNLSTLVATGLIGVMFGPARSKGRVTITFESAQSLNGHALGIRASSSPCPLTNGLERPFYSHLGIQAL